LVGSGQNISILALNAAKIKILTVIIVVNGIAFREVHLAEWIFDHNIIDLADLFVCN
jgi:hypothetical protein